MLLTNRPFSAPEGFLSGEEIVADLRPDTVSGRPGAAGPYVHSVIGPFIKDFFGEPVGVPAVAAGMPVLNFKQQTGLVPGDGADGTGENIRFEALDVYFHEGDVFLRLEARTRNRS